MMSIYRGFLGAVSWGSCASAPWGGQVFNLPACSVVGYTQGPLSLWSWSQRNRCFMSGVACVKRTLATGVHVACDRDIQIFHVAKVIGNFRTCL